MVRGLDLFRQHFRAFADRYVLIGGTACDLVMREAGLNFRATKDLDIVLCVETIDRAFAEAFWAFVRTAGYQRQESETGQRRFYRFQNPTDNAYPAMLELFARVPDTLLIREGGHLTPIPVSDDVSSLSAILLEDAYYEWIYAGRREIDGVPIVGPEHLIPLKAKAWLDLCERRDAGDTVDSRAIKKHRNDVFRLFQVMDPEYRAEPVLRIQQDLRLFVEKMAVEDVDLGSLGLRSTTRETVLDGLRAVYSLGRIE